MSNYYETCTYSGFPRGKDFFASKPIKLLNKYERWRKVADILNLSKAAKQRLEWYIYYETKANFNASLTCRRFYISKRPFTSGRSCLIR